MNHGTKNEMSVYDFYKFYESKMSPGTTNIKSLNIQKSFKNLTQFESIANSKKFEIIRNQPKALNSFQNYNFNKTIPPAYTTDLEKSINFNCINDQYTF